MRKIWILFAALLFPAIAGATVTSTASTVAFTCTNSTGPFPFTFPALNSAALQVTDQVAGATPGVMTVLAPNQWTATPVNNSFANGGSITLVTPCPTGDTLTIARTTEATQLTAYTPYMPALYANVESNVDQLSTSVQDTLRLDQLHLGNVTGTGIATLYTTPLGQYLNLDLPKASGCAPVGGVQNGVLTNNSGGCNSSAATLDSPGNFVTPGYAQADVWRSNPNWYDARKFGVTCGPKGANPFDNTAAMQTALSITNLAGSELDLPPCNESQGFLYVNPGPSSGDSNLTINSLISYFRIAGRWRNRTTVIADLGQNLSSAPLLQLTNGSHIDQGGEFENIQLQSGGVPVFQTVNAGTGCTNQGAISTTTNGAGTGLLIGYKAVGGATFGAYAPGNATGYGTGYVNGDLINSTEAGCTAQWKYYLYGLAGVSYPNGMLQLNSTNHTGIDGMWIQNDSTGQGTVLLKGYSTASSPINQENWVNKPSLFCSPYDKSGTGIFWQATKGNTTFFEANAELCENAVIFEGTDSTPIFTWYGGHGERQGHATAHNVGNMFWVDQAQVDITAPDAANGNILLHSSVVNSSIHMGQASDGYSTFLSDVGMGNTYRAATRQRGTNQPTYLEGNEWYKLSANAETDPLFKAGTTGWTTTAILTQTATPAPGSGTGASLVLSPLLTVATPGTGCTGGSQLELKKGGVLTAVKASTTASGGALTGGSLVSYVPTVTINSGDVLSVNQVGCTGTFTISGGTATSPLFSVSASTDYLFWAAAYFNPSMQQVQITIKDQASNVVYDSGMFTASQAMPTLPSSYAWRKLTQLLPNTSNTVTGYTITITEPTSPLQPAQISGLGLVPSLITAQSPTLAGTATATGTGLTYQVAVSGQDSTAVNNSVAWPIPAQTYPGPGWAYFKIAAAADSGDVNCTVQNVQTLINQYGFHVLPNTTEIYAIPLSLVQGKLQCNDFYGPVADANDFVISQPFIGTWGWTPLQPITTPNDGKVVLGVTPDGVQQRGVAPTPIIASSLPIAGDLICAHGGDTNIAPLTVTGATNANPTVLTLSNPQNAGYTVGQSARVTGIVDAGSDSNFNGTYTVASTSSTTMGLTCVSGCVSPPGSAYSSGGTVTMICTNTSSDAIPGSLQPYATTLPIPAITTGTQYRVTTQFGVYTPSTAPGLTIPQLTYGATTISSLTGTGALRASSTNVGGAAMYTMTGNAPNLLITSLDSTSLGVSASAMSSTSLLTLSTASPQSLGLKTGFAATGCCTGTYTYVSGGTPSGTGTVTLSSFNNSCTNTTATMVITSGTPGAVTFTDPGFACSAIPTTATCTSGTASCTGTMTFSNVTGTPVLSGPSRTALRLLTFTAKAQ